MFTGIIECLGKVVEIKNEKNNIHFFIDAPFTSELKVDQSVAHNGVCLTVTEINKSIYSVTAIQETLQKTNLGQLKIGDKINLERCMLMNGRLDGHIVQGHVDQTGICKAVEEQNGSWFFTFEYDSTAKNITVEKGSITVNGVSLTVVNSGKSEFSVAIIPYTFEHTNFHQLKKGDTVNLEFDIVGKYVAKLLQTN
ncbi:MAG: riboflavin synthase [Bacteroidetes bacterium]|nr:riboflavin synthase [Bacteroidota bacterium]